MSIMTPHLLKRIVEAALLASAKPMNVAQIQALFEDDEKPSKNDITAAVETIQSELVDRGFVLVEVANGWRFQVAQDLAPWIGRLWEEKPQRYSRALLETLALVAYRQPITRGEIEEIRGVAVSTQIMKTLMERNWIKVVGHRDVPGRPSMYATTRDFLDYFNLKSLEQLPTLAEIRDLDTLNRELNLVMAAEGEEPAEPAAEVETKIENSPVEQAQELELDSTQEQLLDLVDAAEEDISNQERSV